MGRGYIVQERQSIQIFHKYPHPYIWKSSYECCGATLMRLMEADVVKYIKKEKLGLHGVIIIICIVHVPQSYSYTVFKILLSVLFLAVQ